MFTKSGERPGFDAASDRATPGLSPLHTDLYSSPEVSVLVSSFHPSPWPSGAMRTPRASKAVSRAATLRAVGHRLASDFSFARIPRSPGERDAFSKKKLED
jgi:hypothetical protein